MTDSIAPPVFIAMHFGKNLIFCLYKGKNNDIPIGLNISKNKWLKYPIVIPVRTNTVTGNDLKQIIPIEINIVGIAKECIPHLCSNPFTPNIFIIFFIILSIIVTNHKTFDIVDFSLSKSGISEPINADPIKVAVKIKEGH